jgi:hypothetical protein
VRALSTALVLATIVGHREVARAESAERPRIVLVVDASDGLSAGIQNELLAMGFEAIIVSREAQEADDLRALTQSGGGVAGARIVVFERSVRLWLHDRTTGKTLTREVTRPTQSEQASLALHAVELLRASLLELELPESPRGDREPTPALLDAAGVPNRQTSSALVNRRAQAQPHTKLGTASKAARDPARSPSPLLAVELGPGLVGATSDLKPYPALFVAAQLFVSRELRLGGFGWIPLGGMSHEGAQGTSASWVTLFGLEAGWQSSAGLLQPMVSLGLVAAHLRTSGQAGDERWQSSADSALTYGATTRLGLGVALSTNLSVSPQLTAGLQSRYFSIDYANDRAARWGPLWWAGSLTLTGRFQ